MARTNNFKNFATDVADSIRDMTGETGLIPASEFDTRIKSIKTEEDLSEELNVYKTEVTEQELSIDTIMEALEGKAAGSGSGNGSVKPLYLIANGYDITDNTGGYTFNQTAGTVTNAVGIKQGTESLNLYTGLWAHCDITFNNDFDVSKYGYLCIDFAYPSTNVIDSMKQYIGIYAHFVTSGTRIALIEGRTTDRVTIRLPLAGVTSPQQIKISCANLSGSNGQDSSAYTEAHPLMIYNVWLEGELSLQDKSVEIIENGTTNITADEGYAGLNNVEVTVNVPVGEVEIEPDYITDGLIAWFDGTDELDDNEHWNSRVGEDYIYRSSGTTTPSHQKKEEGYFNNMTGSFTTSTDYYVQNYTIEVVGKINASVNSTDVQLDSLTGGTLFGIGRTQSVYVGLARKTGKLRIFNEPNDKTLPEPHENLHGKTFACAIHLEQIIPRSSTSGTDIVNYAFNGGKYNNTSNTVSSIASNNRICNVLSYYTSTYQSSGVINCIRVYNRKLTEEEIAYNFAIDKARFKIEE